MDLGFVSVPKHAKKELGQYPAILTSRLVNDPYMYLENNPKRIRTLTGLKLWWYNLIETQNQNNNQMNACIQIGQSAMVYCLSKFMESSLVF